MCIIYYFYLLIGETLENIFQKPKITQFVPKRSVLGTVVVINKDLDFR